MPDDDQYFWIALRGEHFICPFTNKYLTNPVTLPSGVTVENEHLQQLIRGVEDDVIKSQIARADAHIVDPLGGAPIPLHTAYSLKPNTFIKKIIAQITQADSTGNPARLAWQAYSAHQPDPPAHTTDTAHHESSPPSTQRSSLEPHSVVLTQCVSAISLPEIQSQWYKAGQHDAALALRDRVFHVEIALKDLQCPITWSTTMRPVTLPDGVFIDWPTLPKLIAEAEEAHKDYITAPTTRQEIPFETALSLQPNHYMSAVIQAIQQHPDPSSAQCYDKDITLSSPHFLQDFINRDEGFSTWYLKIWQLSKMSEQIDALTTLMKWAINSERLDWAWNILPMPYLTAYLALKHQFQIPNSSSANSRLNQRPLDWLPNSIILASLDLDRFTQNATTNSEFKEWYRNSWNTWKRSHQLESCNPFLPTAKEACEAAKLGMDPFIKILHEANPEVLKACDKNGMQPAHYAIKYRQDETLQLLLKLDPTIFVEIDQNGDTLLDYAILHNCFPALKMLLELAPDPTAAGASTQALKKWLRTSSDGEAFIWACEYCPSLCTDRHFLEIYVALKYLESPTTVSSRPISPEALPFQSTADLLEKFRHGWHSENTTEPANSHSLGAPPTELAPLPHPASSPRSLREDTADKNPTNLLLSNPAFRQLYRDMWRSFHARGLPLPHATLEAHYAAEHGFDDIIQMLHGLVPKALKDTLDEWVHPVGNGELGWQSVHFAIRYRQDETLRTLHKLDPTILTQSVMKPGTLANFAFRHPNLTTLKTLLELSPDFATIQASALPELSHWLAASKVNVTNEHCPHFDTTIEDFLWIFEHYPGLCAHRDYLWFYVVLKELHSPTEASLQTASSNTLLPQSTNDLLTRLRETNMQSYYSNESPPSGTLHSVPAFSQLYCNAWRSRHELSLPLPPAEEEARYAASHGLVEIIQMLHELAPTALKTPDEHDWQPIHFAIQHQQHTLIKLLHELDPAILTTRETGSNQGNLVAFAIHHSDLSVLHTLHECEPHPSQPDDASFANLRTALVTSTDNKAFLWVCEDYWPPVLTHPDIKKKWTALTDLRDLITILLREGGTLDITNSPTRLIMNPPPANTQIQYRVQHTVNMGLGTLKRDAFKITKLPEQAHSNEMERLFIQLSTECAAYSKATDTPTHDKEAYTQLSNCIYQYAVQLLNPQQIENWLKALAFFEVNTTLLLPISQTRRDAATVLAILRQDTPDLLQGTLFHEFRAKRFLDAYASSTNTHDLELLQGLSVSCKYAEQYLDNCQNSSLHTRVKCYTQLKVYLSEGCDSPSKDTLRDLYNTLGAERLLWTVIQQTRSSEATQRCLAMIEGIFNDEVLGPAVKHDLFQEIFCSSRSHPSLDLSLKKSLMKICHHFLCTLLKMESGPEKGWAQLDPFTQSSNIMQVADWVMAHPIHSLHYTPNYAIAVNDILKFSLFDWTDLTSGALKSNLRLKTLLRLSRHHPQSMVRFIEHALPDLLIEANEGTSPGRPCVALHNEVYQAVLRSARLHPDVFAALLLSPHKKVQTFLIPDDFNNLLIKHEEAKSHFLGQKKDNSDSLLTFDALLTEAKKTHCILKLKQQYQAEHEAKMPLRKRNRQAYDFWIGGALIFGGLLITLSTTVLLSLKLLWVAELKYHGTILLFKLYHSTMLLPFGYSFILMLGSVIIIMAAFDNAEFADKRVLSWENEYPDDPWNILQSPQATHVKDLDYQPCATTQPQDTTALLASSFPPRARNNSQPKTPSPRPTCPSTRRTARLFSSEHPPTELGAERLEAMSELTLQYIQDSASYRR